MRPWLLASLLAGLVALAGTLPDPSTRVAGQQFLDGMGTQWFYWYAEQALTGREALSHSQLLFFPFGKDVFLHTGGNLIDAWLALPLRLVLGHVAGYNASILLIFALNGWAAARLAASFGARAPGQAAAAALVSLNPYVLIELDQGRPTQALVAALPMALAMLRERRGVLAGLALALCGFTYWYYGLVAGITAAITGFIALFQGPDRRAVVKTWALACLTCLALVLPVAWPMLGSLEAGGVPGLLVYDGQGPLGGLHLATAEGDPQGIFVQTLDGRAGPLTPAGGAPHFVEGARLVGLPHVLLALPAVLLLRARAAMLLVWVALGAALAAGPVFSLSGPENPLYLALLDHLSMVRRWWWPMRASALEQVALAVLAGVGFSGLADLLGLRFGARAARLAWLALPPLAWAWTLGNAPLSTWSGEVSPVVSTCLREAPEGAVIDLPLAWDQFHLYHQVWHEKPQMGGMLSQKAAFGSGRVDELLAANDFAGALVAYGDRQFRREPSLDEGQRQALLALGYRYILVRHEAFAVTLPDGRVRDDRRRIERLISHVLGPPVGSEAESPHPVTLWTLDGSRPPCAWQE